MIAWWSLFLCHSRLHLSSFSLSLSLFSSLYHAIKSFVLMIARLLRLSLLLGFQLVPSSSPLQSWSSSSLALSSVSSPNWHECRRKTTIIHLARSSEWDFDMSILVLSESAQVRGKKKKIGERQCSVWDRAIDIVLLKRIDNHICSGDVSRRRETKVRNRYPPALNRTPISRMDRFFVSAETFHSGHQFDEHRLQTLIASKFRFFSSSR